MKKFLFILGFGCIAGTVNAQQVQDANHVVKGYITKDGTIQDKNTNTLCSFRPDGRVIDPKSNTVAYMINEYELQDKDHKTVGYIQPNGTVEDSKHVVIGHMPKYGSGAVTDANNNTLGYIDEIEPTRAAVYFFVLKY